MDIRYNFTNKNYEEETMAIRFVPYSLNGEAYLTINGVNVIKVRNRELYDAYGYMLAYMTNRVDINSDEYRIMAASIALTHDKAYVDKIRERICYWTDNTI